eukprot:1149447-Pelagomonas_calceolata.AAC.3
MEPLCQHCEGCRNATSFILQHASNDSHTTQMNNTDEQPASRNLADREEPLKKHSHQMCLKLMEVV